MANQNYIDYLNNLKRPYIKICRLRFLQPDGSTAFALDNDYMGKRNKTFIASGNLSVNLQNGQRRNASVTLDNVNEEYDYQYGKMWFGQEIALDEGMILPDGTEYYIQQGVFLIDNPQEDVKTNGRTARYNLVDKWANLDGSHLGNLEGTYEVAVGTNIFNPIVALLAEDRGNGLPLDGITPVFTEYYNLKTQKLPDGTTVSFLDSPYTLTVDAGSTKADVVLGLCEMINAWVGYDASGALRIDPSQDDIRDATKPIAYSFSMSETSLLGLSYTVKDEDMYNDYIVVGDQLDDNSQPFARAMNYDPKSDTNINIVGKKTYREEANGYGTDTQCKDLAVWKLKRATVLKKAVNVSASQVLHLQENQLIEIVRTDKEDSPVERHLIQGFSRPLVGTQPMTINAVSVMDFPDLTVITRDSL